MSLVAKEWESWEGTIDVFSNLIKTRVMEAIILKPEIILGYSDNIKFLHPEISLCGG